MRKFFNKLFGKKTVTPPKAPTFWSRFVDGLKMAFAGAVIGAAAVTVLMGRIYYRFGIIVAPVAAALCIGMGWMVAAEAWLALAMLAWMIKIIYESFVWLEQLIEKLWPRGGNSYRYEGVNARGEHVYG